MTDDIAWTTSSDTDGDLYLLAMSDPNDEWEVEVIDVEGQVVARPDRTSFSSPFLIEYSGRPAWWINEVRDPAFGWRLLVKGEVVHVREPRNAS